MNQPVTHKAAVPFQGTMGGGEEAATVRSQGGVCAKLRKKCQY